MPKVTDFDELLEIESFRYNFLPTIFTALKTDQSATIFQNDWIGISLAVLERRR